MDWTYSFLFVGTHWESLSPAPPMPLFIALGSDDFCHSRASRIAAVYLPDPENECLLQFCVLGTLFASP